MEPKTGFGRWFRDNQLSYDLICRTLDCGSGYAYEILNGTRTPSMENTSKLIAIAKDLKCSKGCKTCGAVLTLDDFLLVD